MASSLRCLSAQFQRRLAITVSNYPRFAPSFERQAVLTQPTQWFSSDKGEGEDSDTKEVPVETSNEYVVQEIMDSFRDTSYYDPVERPDYSHMTNEELENPSAIPGWELIHSPPKDRSVPRGALVGTVVSTKMQKTVNVAVDRYKVHPKYRKRLRYTRKFMAHDEKEVANAGDLVMITPCHRISKHKHFMLREIIRPKGQL
eukprot:scaffold15259_cov122-Cylindrotheca_fusiformis.AAC.1